MNDNEQDIIDRLNVWKVDVPPAALADSIYRHAVQQPQQRSWFLSLGQTLETAFTQWQYGLSYKLACLALCAALGLSSGEVTPPQEDELSLAAEFAFADTVGDEP